MEEEGSKAMSDCHLRCAARALFVFEKNGGIYIKLGQHLAALSYLIPIVCVYV
jgi:aarF domain-containing kinase